MREAKAKLHLESRIIKIHEALLIYKFSTHSTIHPSPPSAMPSMHFPHLPLEPVR